MADDIVDRLRMFSLDDGTDALNKLLAQSADKIERLRASNDHLLSRYLEVSLHPNLLVRGE